MYYVYFAYHIIYFLKLQSSMFKKLCEQVINKKELCKDEDKMFLVEKEIEIMSQLDHPNIVKLYEVYVNSEEVNRIFCLKVLLSSYKLKRKFEDLWFEIFFWPENFPLYTYKSCCFPTDKSLNLTFKTLFLGKVQINKINFSRFFLHLKGL